MTAAFTGRSVLYVFSTCNETPKKRNKKKRKKHEATWGKIAHFQKKKDKRNVLRDRAESE